MQKVFLINFNSYERDALKMGKIINISGNKDQKADTDSKPKRDNGFKKTILTELFISLICFIAGIIYNKVTGYDSLSKEITDLDVKLENRIEILDTSINSNLNELDTNIKTINENNNKQDNDIKELRGYVFDLLGIIDPIRPTSTGVKVLSITYSEELNEYYLSEKPSWNSNTIIAKGLETGTEYTASDLANKKILLPYKDGINDIVFYGQFDENNQWDDTCIINVYNNGFLKLIMEASYKNGELLKYRQVLSGTLSNGEDVWIVSEREHHTEYNYGNSWNYKREENYQIKFDFDEIIATDVLDIDTFVLNIKTDLVSFYHGNTSNGLYNDNTGLAYLVKYANDGTVKTIYSGNFVDGQFEDTTSNAWYITRDINTDYMYFKGNFLGGNPQTSEKIVYLKIT